MGVNRLMAVCLFLIVLSVAGCEGGPAAEKSLYPIRGAPARYTVVFLRYYDDPEGGRTALSLANDATENFRAMGHEVYVVHVRNIALLCLGSFNEPEGTEAKRTLEVATRLLRSFGVPQDRSVVSRAGSRTVMRKSAFEPHIVSIEYLKTLEKIKPGEAVLTIQEEGQPPPGPVAPR
jgi:hypothetical protein